MIVDLHIHTDASDGCDNPVTLIQKAQAKGIGLLAVSDHDSIDNVAAVQSLAKQANIEVISGVEICSSVHKESFHILAYNFDLQNKGLQELLQYNQQLLSTKDQETIEILKKLGWAVDLAEYQAYERPRNLGGWKTLNYLQAKGLCTGVSDFFERIFTAQNGLSFPTFLSPSEVIAVIHQAGGAAVLAHAGSSFHGQGLQRALDIFATQKLDGFECYHPEHSLRDTQLLVEHCQRENLLITAGSDYHGDFLPTRHSAQPEVGLEVLNLVGLRD